MKLLFAKFRSEIFGMIGVLAVCGVGALIIAWLHIQRQDDQLEAKEERIEGLVTANKGWALHAAEQDRLRALEQKNTLLLQDKVDLIEKQGVASAAQIKDLEQSNEEVRRLMAQRLPADLRKLLEQQK
ncbi:MAG: hypothetical protein DI555_07130 [Novosphingobium pentaromativorans]|uniref:Uncharacterized protein n=1 Tax=Novosphingobium pentaromativorans TaxID=205844 RepID=A0A2W5NQI4_9SPHN|nr:MAG: hypothetical protein DI555_07130 [Novosphingobium pentaromativorans]